MAAISTQISHVGIVGAGQLGRMLALAAYPLGLKCTFLDRSRDSPAGQLAPTLVGELESASLLAELARSSDVLTFDWENISAAALEPLQKRVPIRPPIAALEVSQDRLREKALFSALKIPTTDHAPIDSRSDLQRALASLGLPAVLKTRRLGYDGKGQAIIRTEADAEGAYQVLGHAPLIYERYVGFSSEVSIIGARSTRNECAYYPLARNTHHGGILRYCTAPFRHAALARLAQIYLKRIFDRLDYHGVLAIEFFVAQGKLIANEMAPRVHNSGHWTIEGTVTSQFENHLRAICGMPLGSTRPLGHAAMVNFLGLMPDKDRLLRIPGLAFHDYGKEPRPGRKIGHCTVLAPTAAERDRLLKRVRRCVPYA
jgi:5-(carboxyamino)imidazole ribonucleotide synthase